MEGYDITHLFYCVPPLHSVVITVWIVNSQAQDSRKQTGETYVYVA